MAKAVEPDPEMYELADDGGVVDLLTRDTLYFLDMVFAANINDKDEHCQLADHDGCDLWMAELVYNETQGTLTMNDLASVYDNSDYGEWFADLAVTDKTTNEFLVYYTRYDPVGTGEAGKNSIGGFVTDGDDWVVYSLAYGNISQANFPAIAESTDYLAYTAIETNGDKNVMRYTPNAYHTPTGSPVLWAPRVHGGQRVDRVHVR